MKKKIVCLQVHYCHLLLSQIQRVDQNHPLHHHLLQDQIKKIKRKNRKKKKKAIMTKQKEEVEAKVRIKIKNIKKNINILHHLGHPLVHDLFYFMKILNSLKYLYTIN